ncbi:hypothetical protein HKX48_005318, partial [Thoreauomyces humboldtii]
MPHVIINSAQNPAVFRLPNEETTEEREGLSTAVGNKEDSLVDEEEPAEAALPSQEETGQPLDKAALQAETILERSSAIRNRLSVLVAQARQRLKKRARELSPRERFEQASKDLLADRGAPKQFRELYLKTAVPVRVKVAETAQRARRIQENLEGSSEKVSTQLVANLNMAADAVDALEEALKSIDLTAAIDTYQSGGWKCAELRKVVDQVCEVLEKQKIEPLLASAA